MLSCHGSFLLRVISRLSPLAFLGDPNKRRGRDISPIARHERQLRNPRGLRRKVRLLLKTLLASSSFLIKHYFYCCVVARYDSGLKNRCYNFSRNSFNLRVFFYKIKDFGRYFSRIRSKRFRGVFKFWYFIHVLDSSSHSGHFCSITCPSL